MMTLGKVQPTFQATWEKITNRESPLLPLNEKAASREIQPTVVGSDFKHSLKNWECLPLP